MFGRNDLTDKALLKSVERRLERTGMKSRLNATMRQGTVTITGQLQYEKQRLQIINAVKGVSGVRQVVDQLRSPPKLKPQPVHNAVASRVAPQEEKAPASEVSVQAADVPMETASVALDESAVDAS